MNRRIWNGRFSLHARGDGALELCAERGEVRLLLLGVESGTSGADGLRADPDRFDGQVEACWRDEGATLRLIGNDGDRELRAAGLLVHEPLPGVYEDLRLPRLRPRTRRFWQRLFLLARLPGGAMLIRFIARHARAKA